MAAARVRADECNSLGHTRACMALACGVALMHVLLLWELGGTVRLLLQCSAAQHSIAHNTKKHAAIRIPHAILQQNAHTVQSGHSNGGSSPRHPTSKLSLHIVTRATHLKCSLCSFNLQPVAPMNSEQHLSDFWRQALVKLEVCQHGPHSCGSIVIQIRAGHEQDDLVLGKGLQPLLVSIICS